MTDGHSPCTQDEARTRRVLEVIRRAGSAGIIRKHLLQQTHFIARQLDTHLDTLLQSELVIELPEGKGRRYVALTGEG